MKNLFIFLIMLLGSGALANDASFDSSVEIIQNSGFGAMYDEAQQNSLLYDSRQIIEDVFYKELKCQDVQVDALVTNHGKDGFWVSLMGETIEPTFELKISAQCPHQIKNIETYLYFGFQRDEIPIVFYFTYLDANINQVKSFVIIDEFGYLPRKEESKFSSITLCEKTWLNEEAKYPLLFNAHCN